MIQEKPQFYALSQQQNQLGTGGGNNPSATPITPAPVPPADTPTAVQTGDNQYAADNARKKSSLPDTTAESVLTGGTPATPKPKTVLGS